MTARALNKSPEQEAIERLTRKIAVVIDELERDGFQPKAYLTFDEWCETHVALTRLRVLEEALEPFAEFAAWMDALTDKEAIRLATRRDEFSKHIPVADFRRAAQALRGTG